MENSHISDVHRLKINFMDKMDLQRGYQHVRLSDLSIYYTWKNIKKSYKNNKFKIAGITWDEEFELPDRSYSGQILNAILNTSSTSIKR